MNCRPFQALFFLLAAACSAAEEEKAASVKPCVEIVRADGSERIVVSVQNPTAEAISVFSPGSARGDRSFHLIVQKPRGIITSGCFLQPGYPHPAPAVTEVPAHSSKELTLLLNRPLKQIFPDAVGITVTYTPAEAKEGDADTVAAAPKGIDHLDGREKSLAVSSTKEPYSVLHRADATAAER